MSGIVMGKLGKVILSGLATLAAALILFGVALPSETMQRYERVADPVGALLGLAFIAYAVVLWLARPRRLYAILIFIALLAATVAAAYGLDYWYRHTG